MVGASKSSITVAQYQLNLLCCCCCWPFPPFRLFGLILIGAWCGVAVTAHPSSSSSSSWQVSEEMMVWWSVVGSNEHYVPLFFSRSVGRSVVVLFVGRQVNRVKGLVGLLFLLFLWLLLLLFDSPVIYRLFSSSSLSFCYSPNLILYS